MARYDELNSSGYLLCANPSAPYAYMPRTTSPRVQIQHSKTRCGTSQDEKACLERGELLNAVSGLEGGVVQAEVLEAGDGRQLDQVLRLQREIEQVKSVDLHHSQMVISTSY